MGKLKGLDEMDAAMNAILDAHAKSRLMRVVFTTDDAYEILDKHGLTVIDTRLATVLDDMPIGLEDLIEDNEDE